MSKKIKKSRIAPISVGSSNVLTFPTPTPRWKHPKPDMDDPKNRKAWEAMIDFANLHRREGW